MIQILLLMHSRRIEDYKEYNTINMLFDDSTHKH